MKSLDSNSRITLPRFLEYINKDDKYLVINPIVPSFLITNETGMCVLKLCDGKNSIIDIKNKLSNLSINLTIDNIKKFLVYAQNKNIFLISSLTPTHKDYMLKTIHLNMTKSCNLSCKYCYAEERIESNFPNLTFDEYKKIIDDVLTISQKIIFNFTGGEPLLSPHTIPVAKYLKEQNQQKA